MTSDHLARGAGGRSSGPSRSRRPTALLTVGLLAVFALFVVFVGSARPVAADAGADLALSAARGPAGTVVELASADVFAMGADRCPGLSGDRTWNEGDTFEVRWELGLLPDDVVGSPVAEGSDFRYTTMGTPVVRVLDRGVVATEVDVPWHTTITVPAGVEPGQRLVVTGGCWRRGAGLPDGGELWFGYYYLPVFTVTSADGSVPTTTAPTTVSSPGTTATTVAAAPAPPVAAPAAARPGVAAFTG